MVPVLTVDQAVIFDSVAIMEFANDVSGGMLLPTDQLTRARARSIVAWQHSGLSNICARISFESAFYPFKRALTAQEKAECGRLFRMLEQSLGESGGPYLFGAVSLADFALVPTMIRLTRHKVNLLDFPLVAAWASTILTHEHAQEWLQTADSLPHVWLEDYLIPDARVELVPNPQEGFSGP